MTDINTQDYDDIIANLTTEFLDDANDRLSRMEQALNGVVKGTWPAREVEMVLRRETHSLKGMGGSYGFGAITQIAHRFEEYLVYTADGVMERADKLFLFLDAMSRIIDQRENPNAAALGEILRGLPVYHLFSEAEVEIPDAEAMLLVNTMILARGVGTELAACGYRTVTLTDPFDAMASCARLPPDVLVLSAILDGVTGIEVVSAMRQMAITREIPAILLTSFPKDHSALKTVPEGVFVAQIGKNLSDDLGEALSRI